MTIRAKFRCMSVSRHWDNHTSISLSPVYPQKTDKGEEHAENRAWSRWTPSGQVDIAVRGQDPRVDGISFEPNLCYFLDLTTGREVEGDEAAEYELSTMNKSKDQLEVVLTTGWNSSAEDGARIHASVKLGVSNQDAWPPFLAGDVGSRWQVVFSPA